VVKFRTRQGRGLQKRQKRLQRIRVGFFFTVNFFLISCFSGIQQQNKIFLQAEDKGNDSDDNGIPDSIFPPLKKSKFAVPILSDDEIAMVEELDLPEKMNSLDSDNIMEQDKSDQTVEHPSDSTEAGNDIEESDNSVVDNGVCVCFILDFSSNIFLQIISQDPVNKQIAQGQPGLHLQTSKAVSRPCQSDFPENVCMLANAAKNHLHFKIVMGEWNKLRTHANKADWTWKVIQKASKQGSDPTILKQAFASAQGDPLMKRNLITYVSLNFI